MKISGSVKALVALQYNCPAPLPRLACKAFEVWSACVLSGISNAPEFVRENNACLMLEIHNCLLHRLNGVQQDIEYYSL